VTDGALPPKAKDGAPPVAAPRRGDETLGGPGNSMTLSWNRSRIALDGDLPLPDSKSDLPARDGPDSLHQRAEAVRHFNRFYTQRIGILNDRRMWSSFSLTQVRVLYELAQRDGATATQLARDLGVDQGYMSRILRGFERLGYLKRTRSADDARKSHLALTALGRSEFAPLNAQAHAEVADMLADRPETGQVKLLAAMRTIERVLSDEEPGLDRYVVRAPRPGDFGWIVQRHGAIYAQERGWDERFEALVAKVVAEFLRKCDPERERCFIAEKDGENAGSVLCVKKTETVAQLRLLLVEPGARGHGIGTRLVDECVRFARRAGYRKIILWTERGLDAAHRIYERAGFRMVGEQPSAGLRVGQTWERSL
jgi:DNA-binding MarR family transcriptional regulator/predicted N-acetyltransferase YhbS